MISIKQNKNIKIVYYSFWILDIKLMFVWYFIFFGATCFVIWGFTC